MAEYSSPPSTLTVLLFFPTADSNTPNDWKNERLTLFLETQLPQYDILLLQETWTPASGGRKERLMRTAYEQGYHYYARSACAGRLVDAMLLILSRHPLTSFSEWTYSNSMGDEKKATKGVMHARALLHGKSTCRLDLFTTHLQSGGGDSGGNAVRSLQTKELATFVRQVSGTGDIVSVIGGDFNIQGRQRNGTPNGTQWQVQRIGT